MGVRTAIVAMRTAMTALNAAMLANPVGAFIAALTAAIAVSYVVVQNWEKIKETILGFFDAISKGWEKVKGFFGFDEAAGTTGGLNYIGPLGGDAGQAISPASVSNSSSTYTSDTSVNIGKVEVQTAATDAEGVSRDIGRGLQNNLNSLTVNNANTGVRQ